MQPDGIWHCAEQDPPSLNHGETAALWTFSHPQDSGYADWGCMAHLREIDWPAEKHKLAAVWTVKTEGRPVRLREEAPKPGERVEFR